jgi:flagellar hook-basal body complex protein FliE
MDSIIVPLQHLERIGSIFQTEETSHANSSESTGLFKDILETAMNNVVSTDNAAVNDTEDLATGDVDDVHRLSIDNYEASLAVSMLVQIRNRALESYNQIMQTTV